MRLCVGEPASSGIDPLSLHDALPISSGTRGNAELSSGRSVAGSEYSDPATEDRKSTRLNSSHSSISYAVFCLKKKNECILAGRKREQLTLGGPRNCSGRDAGARVVEP